MTEVKFEIIVSGLDLLRHCEDCLKSISRQTYKNFIVHLLSDEDKKADLHTVKNIETKYQLNKKVKFKASTGRVGKACLVFDYIQENIFEENSVIVMLDSDDMFATKDALLEFSRVYSATNTDACWSTYVTSQGHLGHSAPLIHGISHRLQGWRSSHCFTYRANLMKKVPREYILDKNGRPVMQACDIALALPILDISKRCSFIPKILYRYTSNNPESHHNQHDGVGLSSKRQQATASALYKMSPLRLV